VVADDVGARLAAVQRDTGFVGVAVAIDGVAGHEYVAADHDAAAEIVVDEVAPRIRQVGVADDGGGTGHVVGHDEATAAIGINRVGLDAHGAGVGDADAAGDVA